LRLKHLKKKTEEVKII